MKPSERTTMRVAMLLAGLALTGFGVALVTKAQLGTSPIAAIPYTLSLIIPGLSFGEWMILFSLMLILVEIVLLRNSLNRTDLLGQILLSFCFGYLIDLAMWTLSWFNPTFYAIRIIAVFAGCFITAVGVHLELQANISMLPGDAFARAISIVSKVEYGKVRTFSDVGMSALAAVLCVMFLESLAGVREGTIIAAIMTGQFVRFLVSLAGKRDRSTCKDAAQAGQRANVGLNHEASVQGLDEDEGREELCL